jgi:hypothetical protein
MSELQSKSRRQFIKKSAYVVPVVLTLKAAPSLAGQGSQHHDYPKHDYPKKNKPKSKYNNKNKNNKKNNKPGFGW